MFKYYKTNFSYKEKNKLSRLKDRFSRYIWLSMRVLLLLKRLQIQILYFEYRIYIFFRLFIKILYIPELVIRLRTPDNLVNEFKITSLIRSFIFSNLHKKQNDQVDTRKHFLIFEYFPNRLNKTIESFYYQNLLHYNRMICDRQDFMPKMNYKVSMHYKKDLILVSSRVYHGFSGYTRRARCACVFRKIHTICRPLYSLQTLENLVESEILCNSFLASNDRKRRDVVEALFY